MSQRCDPGAVAAPDRRASDAVRSVHVVVPARNEAALLPACLDALTVASAHAELARPDVAVRITVVLDSCTDTSAAVCRSYQVGVVEIDAGNVGRARAAGTCLALTDARASGMPAQSAWVAWTDADSKVGPDWLLDQVEVAENGADLVLGRVEPDDTAPRDIVRRWHLLHPAGHVSVHGAHLGFRLALYNAVGGVSALTEHEDVDLVARLGAAGARTSRANARVMTSSRLQGRTDGGFSGYLAGLASSRRLPPAEG